MRRSYWQTLRHGFLLALITLLSVESDFRLEANPLDFCSKAIAKVVRKFQKHSDKFEFVSGWPDAYRKLHFRARQLKDDQAEVFFFSRRDRPTLDLSILLFRGEIFILDRSNDPEKVGYA